MRGAAGAVLQSCLILLVRADQWRLNSDPMIQFLFSGGKLTAGDLLTSLMKVMNPVRIHLLLFQQSDLNSFLWTIRREPPAYFYGTIHVPYTRVWDFIPENSKQNFLQSNVVDMSWI
ncbi:Metalloprotease TIKI1 [Takifugu flavidus]|uniref:Metalloprotease TIKI n=1 Tax=Takifugu flavidus TaxID=433684 RepID=A0A5C6NIZ6_9TELE|nr:Metalloprotease TIKI1 [Takifugu flavidus]